jgi:MoaA/NifB/PqqE/SkfB family radical SAM enzyme
MNFFHSWKRKTEAYKAGVVHATLDPEGPGVVRMHLIPPKPLIFKDPPSLLILNGSYFLPVGPSWSAILRELFKVLNDVCADKLTLTNEEIAEVERQVGQNVGKLYPGVTRDRIINDMREILTIAVNVATGQPVPKGLSQGMDLNAMRSFMTAPHRMDLIVAPMSVGSVRECPLECACCYASAGSVMDVAAPLSTQTWKKIIDKCKAAGIPMLTFTGGEPLSRSDLPELVDYAKWFVTRVNTSGILLTPEMAKALRQASLDGIQITLYSENSAIHDALTGRAKSWDGSVKGIRNALASDLSVSINTPLMELNRHYEKTLRFLHSEGVQYVNCSSLIPAGGAKDQIKTGNALTKEQLSNILSDAVALCRELKMELSYTSPGWLSSEELIKIGILTAPLCGACLSNMAVSPSGKVVPCQSWLSGETLGDMIEDRWESVWQNPLCVKIRKEMAAKPNCGLKEMKI